jgi:hypothetical protein
MALTPNTQTGHLFGKQKGTNDTLRGIDNGNSDRINGDAFEMHDCSRGGNDRLIGGNNNVSDILNGDAVSMYGHSRGGNDNIIGGNGSIFFPVGRRCRVYVWPLPWRQ